ncbi:hypothetical protein Taro_023278 [Colocasia esculenta]|uniref:Uncharacterized protein n=1 Tax=Colocasia esculenta TaxID=4460 RepID=A0A843V602_COLES|nr:hypothetical protein [Colocasia esculenta]
MVAWVARATIERGEYELDEEADDPEDPPHPNTFLERAVEEATAEDEGDRGNVGQPYSPHYEMDPEAEVDLLGDIELELVERRGGGHGHDDDDDFERLMEGLPRTQSRRRGSSTQDAPPSQSIRPPTSSQLAKGKQIAQESRRKKTGAIESRPSKGVVIREPPPAPAQKKKSRFSGWGSKKGKKGATIVEDPLDIADAETLDPNVVLLQMLEVTVVVTMEVEVVTVVREKEIVTVVREEEEVEWHSQRSNFIGVQHKIVVMMPHYSTIEGRSLHLAVKQEMAQLNVVRPGCQVWDHYLSQFRQRYHTMMTWDEYGSFVSQTKGHHLIGELPSESDESKSMPSQSQWNPYDPYQQGHWGY